MKIIAFGHRQNVGKDTAANFVSTHYKINNPGSRVIKTGFASKVKSIAYELYSWAGMEDEEYYEIHRGERDMVLPAIGKTVRQIWIEIGNLLREIYEGTWLEYSLSKRCNLIVFKDLRYMSEVDGVHERDGLCVHIENPNIPIINDEADCALEGKDWADIKIVNNGDLNQFHNDVINSVKDYLNE